MNSLLYSLVCLTCLFSSALSGEIKDIEGTPVMPVGQQGRVLSLSPATTEIMFHIGAQDQLVGRTDRCNFPKTVQSIPSIGSLFPPNLEMIIRSKPHLVLMASGNLQLKEKLRSMKISVFVTQPKTIRGIADNIRAIGALTGRSAVADKKAQIFEQTVHQIQTKSAERQLRVYWEIWPQPMMTIGGSSFVHDLITVAGGINIFADQTNPWPTVSAEAVIRRRPNLVVTVDREAFLNKRKHWLKLLGITADRVIHIEHPDILHRPSPRVLEGLDWLHTVLSRLQ